jgi:hypothetical protein
VRLVLTDLERRSVFGGGEPAHQATTARFGAHPEGLRASLARASEQWEDEPIAVQLSMTPRENTAARVRSSFPPQRRSTPARGFALSSLPTGRTQSSEPPRIPPFEARSATPTAPIAPLGNSSGGGLSWGALFPAEQAKEISQLEQDLVRGDFRSAALRADALFSENLAEAADDLGLEAPERQPAVVALCLGLSADRLRDFRASIRRARAGAEITERDALDTYAILIELNRMRSRIQG